MEDYNPIKSVNGKPVRCPSSYVYRLEDISASDAGRTEDTMMHKKRVGQVTSIELSWNNISTADASAILKAFDPEYITVEFLDARLGNYRTTVFYVGDRSAPMYNAVLGLWKDVSFNLIERSGV